MLKAAFPLVSLMLMGMQPVVSTNGHPTLVAVTIRVDDAAILSGVAQKDSMEIALGALGVERGMSPGVKEFGRMLQRDHGKHLRMVEALAKRLGIPLTTDPAVTVDGDATLQGLRATSSGDFDMAFLDLNREIHTAVLEEFRNELIPGATNAQVKAMLRSTTPTLSAHLGMAKRLLQSVEE